MEIVHICIAQVYKENMEYQENALIRKHKQMGHNVTVITTQATYDDQGFINKTWRDAGVYYNDDGVKVIALPYDERFKIKRIHIRFKIIADVYDTLVRLDPDIILCHGLSFFNTKDIAKYMRNNKKTKLYADSHQDYYNAPLNTLKRFIVFRTLKRFYAKKIEKYTTKFWGTLPIRVNYMIDVYKIDPSKVDLLIMGGDTERRTDRQRMEITNKIRDSYGIDKDAFLIATGGKIDRNKNVHLLIDSINRIKNKNIYLIIFGKLHEDMKFLIDVINNSKNIKFVGWKKPKDCYDIFYASDLAVFPGTHSVLWENACACETPIIAKQWFEMTHLDVGGNCIFLKDDSIEEIEYTIRLLCEKGEKYQHMLSVSREKCYDVFSYDSIARKAIGME